MPATTELLMDSDSPESVLFYYRTGLGTDTYLKRQVDAFKKMSLDDRLELLFIMCAMHGRTLGALATVLGAKIEVLDPDDPSTSGGKPS